MPFGTHPKALFATIKKILVGVITLEKTKSQDRHTDYLQILSCSLGDLVFPVELKTIADQIGQSR